MAALSTKACEQRRGLCVLGGRWHGPIFLQFSWTHEAQGGSRRHPSCADGCHPSPVMIGGTFHGSLPEATPEASTLTGWWDQTALRRS